MAGLFLDSGGVLSVAQQPTPAATLSPFERLAKPTLPAEPAQADLGAQDYWLYCLPCHGDRGQGLTDEFRTTYPPEEFDCWESGCHGRRPYESGFTLPDSIPAVIGAEALTKFADGAQLQSYIRAAMPFWKPGSLTDEESWKVTAFVLRANGLWDGTAELGPDNASRVKIQRGAASPAPTVEGSVGRSAPGLGYAPVVLVPLAVLVVFLFLRLKKHWIKRDSP